MSYILDALRRLEQDKERSRRGTNPMEAVLVPDLEEAKTPFRWRFRWVGTVFVLLAAVVAATYWITRHTLVMPPEQAREADFPFLSSVRPGEPLSIDPSSPEGSIFLAQTPSSGGERSVPSSVRSTGSIPGVSARSSPPTESPFPSVPEPEFLPTGDAEGSWPWVPEDAYPLVGRRDSIAVSPGIPETEVIQAWRGTDIKINAIAYSPDRKNRFAMVNLKTLHEGDEFEGLWVHEILEDGIVFEEGGTKYKVLLGRR